MKKVDSQSFLKSTFTFFKFLSFNKKKKTDDPNFEENEFFAVTRDLMGDSVESVELIDEFIHPKTKRRSMCFRFTYRDLERTLTHEEVNFMQDNLVVAVRERLGVELR